MLRRISILALMSLSGAACAQGYFDFGQIPGVAENARVQIDLNPTMLGFVTEAARAADPAAGELLTGIQNVRVRVYDVGDDAAEFLAFIDDVSGQLEDTGWQRTVYVEEDEQKVRIYMKIEDNVATGLTLMVAGEDDEAVFVNIAGTINPTQLGQLMHTLGAGEALSQLTGIQTNTAQ